MQDSPREAHKAYEGFTSDSNTNDSFEYEESIEVEAEEVPSPIMSDREADQFLRLDKMPSFNILDTDSDDGELIRNPNAMTFSPNSESSTTNKVQNSKSQPFEGPVKNSAGPSKPPKMTSARRAPQQRSVSTSDSGDSEIEMKTMQRRPLPGEYNPQQYESLKVSDEIKDVFQFITKYVPQQMAIDFQFKPFIPHYIPAVGDIDAFIKVMPPDQTIDDGPYTGSDAHLGLTVLDEPAVNQSDPALLYLKLKATSASGSHSNESMVVKKIDNVEKNSRIIEKWIKDVTDLHKSKGFATVKYSNAMPDLESLMQEWSEEIEHLVQKSFPSPHLGMSLSEYVDVICSLFDIPVYKNKIQSLHVLFSLYAAIKTSQLYKAANAVQIPPKSSEKPSATQSDHLLLD